METQKLALFSPNTPAGLIPVVGNAFNSLNDKYAINTPARLACFFAQVIHESSAFRYTREIASGSAYEGRKDLGNIYPGDGKLFKGGGYIEITGRANYLQASMDMFGDDRLVKDPDLLRVPGYAMNVSFWFWQKHKLNDYADMPVDRPVVTNHHGTVTPFEFITLLINGGFNGLAQRIDNYNRICKILGLPLWNKLASA